jgi:hypothetical protein
MSHVEMAGTENPDSPEQAWPVGRVCEGDG